MNENVLSGKFLSDILGASDLSDFVMEVQNVCATSPLLTRGAVVCRKADMTVTLAGAEGTGPDDVFGIILDPIVGNGTASVARSGVYDAVQLTVDPSASLRGFADRLRERGIFLEKLEMVGVIPVPTNADCCARSGERSTSEYTSQTLTIGLRGTFDGIPLLMPPSPLYAPCLQMEKATVYTASPDCVLVDMNRIQKQKERERKLKTLTKRKKREG